MALTEVLAQNASERRPRLMMVARLLQFVLVAAAAWGLSFEAASAQASPSDERAPADAPCLWLHSDGAGYSRIVLETADQKHVREWRTAEVLDEKTRLEVREAVDHLTPRSRAVRLKARGDVKFVTVKGLLAAFGAKEPTGYKAYFEQVAQLPPRILGPRR